MTKSDFANKYLASREPSGLSILMKTPDPKKFKYIDYSEFKKYLDERLQQTAENLNMEAFELQQLRHFIQNYQLVTNNNTEQQAIVLTDLNGPVEGVFGRRSCLSPEAIRRAITSGDTPIKLGALVFCDTLDEIYHGLFDAVAISAFRFTVFYSLVANEFGKNIERLKIENDDKVDALIERYMDYRRGQNRVTDLKE